MNGPPVSASEFTDQATQLAAHGQALQAESLCVRALQVDPGHVPAFVQLAELALLRDDTERAVGMLGRVHELAPGLLGPAIRLVRVLWAGGDLASAQAVLERSLPHVSRDDTDLVTAWLLLGQLRRLRGNERGAARAWHHATARVAGFGRWAAASDVPQSLRDLARSAAECARQHRREHLREAYRHLLDQFGAMALERIEQAALGLTAEPPLKPPDPRQRPKFLYVPGLPQTPFLDPFLVPWAARLRDAFPVIRREALDLVESGESIPSFIDVDPGDRMGEYLGGLAEKPAWDAFFFFRRGRRFDANHVRCPATSEVLESLDLFRMAGQAPEICFSYLAPHTTIMPHHGVSNIRLVMHLPLSVPPDCELRLVDVGAHRWREGELMLFDDTYLHEASNHSNRTRTILLMDCWNPHLSATERDALTLLIQAIGEFDQAL